MSYDSFGGNPLALPKHEAASTCLLIFQGAAWTGRAVPIRGQREKFKPSVPITISMNVRK